MVVGVLGGGFRLEKQKKIVTVKCKNGKKGFRWKRVFRWKKGVDCEVEKMEKMSL